MIPVMNQQVQRGIQIKMLIPKELLPASNQPGTPKNVEIRGLSDIPVIIALTEKMAGICFRQIGGRMDYAGFFGSDPLFHSWVRICFFITGIKQNGYDLICHCVAGFCTQCPSNCFPNEKGGMLFACSGFIKTGSFSLPQRTR